MSTGLLPFPVFMPESVDGQDQKDRIMIRAVSSSCYPGVWETAGESRSPANATIHAPETCRRSLKEHSGNTWRSSPAVSSRDIIQHGQKRFLQLSLPQTNSLRENKLLVASNTS